MIRTSVTDETIYSKNSVKTGETSKQNKKIKKIGSIAVPKEKTITVKFLSKGELCLKNNSSSFYCENRTQAWANGCIANLTIVLVALITLSHTVVRHKNVLFSLRVTNMTFLFNP